MGIFTIAVMLSAIHISPSGAIISVALKASRNASPSGAVMWKLRGYIVALLGLIKMISTFYRYYRPAGAGFGNSMDFFVAFSLSFGCGHKPNPWGPAIERGDANTKHGEKNQAPFQPFPPICPL